jgi:hypothetical protein
MKLKNVYAGKKMRKTLLATVTMAFLAHGANAAYTLSDLESIESFISSSDWVGFNQYLIDNPDVLVGNGPLAVEARGFQSSFRSSGIARFFNPPTPPSFETIASLTEQY